MHKCTPLGVAQTSKCWGDSGSLKLLRSLNARAHGGGGGIAKNGQTQLIIDDYNRTRVAKLDHNQITNQNHIRVWAYCLLHYSSVEGNILLCHISATRKTAYGDGPKNISPIKTLSVEVL